MVGLPPTCNTLARFYFYEHGVALHCKPNSQPNILPFGHSIGNGKCFDVGDLHALSQVNRIIKARQVNRSGV